MATPIPPPPTGPGPTQLQAPSSDAYFPGEPQPVAASRPHWALAGVVGIMLGVGGTFGIQSLMGLSGPNKALVNAVEACELESTLGIHLEDGGKTITFDSKGEEDLIGADYTDVYCLFTELEMPRAISSHIGQTTSVDGRQTETWNGIRVSWSYHPNRGLDGLLVLE